MAQFSWTYPDVKGNHHSVGLYHGDRSGHFILYCNKRIIQLDFKVFESKTYSFMIDDELCEIFLKKQPDGSFEYDFKINEEINTPRNIQRKEKKAIDRKMTYVFGAFFLLAILVFTFGMRHHQGNERKKQFFGEACHYVGSKYNANTLRWEGKPAEATLVFGKKELTNVVIQYELQSSTESFESSFQRPIQDGRVWLPNGFPLQSGDKFYAIYTPGSIDNHHAIEFDKPTGNTLLRYFDLVMASEQKEHGGESPEKIACRVKTILDERGLEGLALLLHRNTLDATNTTFNQTATQQMLNSVFLQKKIKEACAKFE